MSAGATADALGVSGRIATPMVGGGFVGGGMAGRVSTPMVGHGSGQVGGGWGDHRQRTPMYRTGSASTHQQRASSHGRSVLDCVGEGDGSSAQVSPSSTPGHTPPLDMAARQRQMSGLGGNDRGNGSLPLWLRSDRDAAAERGGTSRAGTSDQSKPLWLQDDTNDSSWRSNGSAHSAHSAASAGRPGSGQVHAAPTSSLSSSAAMSSAYQPSVYQLAASSSASTAYMPSLLGETAHPASSVSAAWGSSSAVQQPPQRLLSQSSGRRGGTALLSDLNNVRVGTGYSRAGDGVRC
jgi:hypothetical protein